MFKKSSDPQSNSGNVDQAPKPYSGSAAPAPPSSSGSQANEQPQSNRQAQSVLGRSIVVKGDISGSEDLVVEGKVEGTISLPKNEVLVGPEGKVKANLTALKVSIEGQVRGDIRGSERVVIKHSGHVEGNIVAPRVVLEDGCQFKGSVEMNTDASSSGGPSGGTKPQNHSQQSAPRSEAAGGSKSAPDTKANPYAPRPKSNTPSAS